MSSSNIYQGSESFRVRLVLSILSGRPIRIVKIRTQGDNPGLHEYEAGFIRLLDKITNGTKVEVNETGTAIYFQPGLLVGGPIEHDCSCQRGIGYYLESVMQLAPFCKKPLKIVLRGVTNDQVDTSVDALKCVFFPILRRFVVDDEGLDMKINRRGAPPLGGGEVFFSCPVRKQLRPFQFLDPGLIKRIRGTAYAVQVSPAMANRMVESAKGLLLKVIPDVFITTDHRKGVGKKGSPGYGIVLIAETTKGAFLVAESSSNPINSGKPPSVPEDIGLEAANRLLQEIYRGGCVDSNCQSSTLLFMALYQKDVSKIMTGPLSPYTIKFLRTLRDFFGTQFKVETKQRSHEEEDLRTGCDKVILTCIGVGYTNLSKTVA
ncbi:RNA 3'-terminal phosphate cyclase-like protein isoform X2 [Artemia franciscana]|uniref:RNA 3'-terminal phosphate cyclase-like protein isoform X2 n=1 Tax=Artemia franciscana TaxID=6661 RepID=UPI0032DAAFBA